MLKNKILILTATALTCLTVSSQTLTVANFGGAGGLAQDIAFIKPFSKTQKIDTRGVEYPGDLPAIRAMLKTRKLEWDVVEVESTDVKIGCDEGLFERIDRSSLQHATFLLPGAVQDCGVGAFVWSTVLAFDSKRFQEEPKSWSDFWDVQRFPGKRGLRKGIRYNLEIALMADGVHRRDVYELLATEQGLDRALAKLEALKPHIVWWESGSQPPQRLLSGEVTMSTAYNGRIAAANRDNSKQQLTISWVNAIYELDYWSIVKGTTKRAQALAFINYVSSEAAQLAFSQEIPYGPTNYGAILRYDEGRKRTTNSNTHLIDLSMAPSDLPSAPGNMRQSLPFSATFWLRNSDRVDKRAALRKP